jgi:hypothetical protein
MIRGKTLPKLLQQALTSGVTSTMCVSLFLPLWLFAHSWPLSLFDAQGSMLAFAGEDINTNQMVAAIVANLWSSFESKEPGLETLLMDFEKGRVVATRTSQFVLCVVGTMQAPLGMLKSKAIALAEYLQGPMDLVLANQ